jgi:hypothetical protein
MTHPITASAGTTLLLAAGFLAACGGSSYGGGGGGGGPATISFAVNPATITLGASATLTWNTNGSNCTASGDWTGQKAASGSEQVTPTEARVHTYELRCGGGRYGESPTRTATLTVNPAAVAALWMAEACCEGTETITVTGMTDGVGNSRFVMGGRHYVSKAGAAPAAYATCVTCLAGARLTEAPPPTLLRVEPVVTARAVPLAGSYTTHLGAGYTLTLTVDAAGEVIGSDTLGCRVNGQVAVRHAAAGGADAVLDVSGCGQSDGRYTGHMALVAGSAGDGTHLLVSASNAEAAIGWRLDR